MSETATEAGDNFAHAPVPQHLTVPGWRVGLMNAVFCIALPDFLNGALTGQALGLWKAVLAAFCAGLFLSLSSCFTAFVSVRSRLSTYLLNQRSFGLYGAGVINIVIAIVHFCWFGVNVTFFGQALVAAAQANGLPSNFMAFVILGTILMAGSTIAGFRTLDRLALIAVPLLAIILGLIAFAAVRGHGLVLAPAPNPPTRMEFGIALSQLIGAYMLAVATMPDLARYITNVPSAMRAMMFCFPVTVPVMMAAAALPALAMHETDVMKLVIELHFGTPILFLLLMPSWTINALNLYSASLSLSATFPTVRRWIFIVAGGVIGTMLALAGIIDAFMQFLLFLGVIIPPIAAVYVIEGLTTFRNVEGGASIRNMPRLNSAALLCWLLSIVVALFGFYKDVTLTTAPALDATIAAALLYGGYVGIRRRRTRG